MAEYDKDQKREGLAFAEALADRARVAPDPESKRDVYAAVNSIRRRYGFSKSEKRAEVLFHIRQGASTIDDLVSETKFNKTDIYEITKELELAREVRFSNLNEGRRGRSKQLIVATESSGGNYSPPKS